MNLSCADTSTCTRRKSVYCREIIKVIEHAEEIPCLR